MCGDNSPKLCITIPHGAHVTRQYACACRITGKTRPLFVLGQLSAPGDELLWMNSHVSYSKYYTIFILLLMPLLSLILSLVRSVSLCGGFKCPICNKTDWTIRLLPLSSAELNEIVVKNSDILEIHIKAFHSDGTAADRDVSDVYILRHIFNTVTYYYIILPFPGFFTYL